MKGKVVVLSEDHKPSNEKEMARIQQAGGWVEFNRVNGNLALSRALGDFVFKRNGKKKVEEQIVIGMFHFHFLKYFSVAEILLSVNSSVLYFFCQEH